jgi:hypothetical protein
MENPYWLLDLHSHLVPTGILRVCAVYGMDRPSLK